MKIIDTKTQKLFSQAYILGGAPCSGKSSMAERMCREFDLQYYKVDDHESEHANRCDPKRHPIMHQYTTMSWNQIWMRPVQQQVEDEFAYYRERFEMIVQDLGRYSLKKPLLVEGAACLPELLEVNAANPRRVIFLVPTKEFQVYHYRQRPWIQPILRECKDAEQAFENWMKRDHGFGQEILRQAKARNYATIVVDGKQNMDEQYEQIKAYLGLG